MWDHLAVVLTIIGMAATFFTSLALFVWWVSTKFFGLKGAVDKGFFEIEKSITTKMSEMHNANIDRFHSLDGRITRLEQRRPYRVHHSKG